MQDYYRTDEDLIEDSYHAYLNEVLQYKVLSRNEEISLFQRIQNGDDVAKDLFIKSNLRLVIKIAKGYYKPGYNQLLDLIQDGNVGLLQAVNLYDPSRGCKFSTYAFYKIHKAIQSSSCRTGLPLEIPQSQFSLITRIRLAIEQLELKNGFPPAPSDLAAYLGVPLDRIELVMPFVPSAVSLNAKIQDRADDREYIDAFSEYYKDGDSEVERACIIKEARNEFYDILKAALSEREFYVLSSRQGLFSTTIKSVREIASELGVSQQCVRQTEERSVAKLRRYLCSMDKSLSDFL